MLAEIGRELSDLLPVLRHLAEAEALRTLAHGHSFEISAATVRSVIAGRRLRDEYFWPAMNENAWSMLLELFANRIEGARLDVAGLCTAAGLDEEIVLNWADWLTARGLVAFRHAEGQRSAIHLTDSGADRMRAYLLASLSVSPWVQ